MGPNSVDHETHAVKIAGDVMEDADVHAVMVEDEADSEQPAAAAVADMLQQFKLPKAPTIVARLPAITNSFANSIIPAIKPTATEVQEVLEVLGMGEKAVCAYCGDTATEWDHFRPVVENKRPTGYVTEIHNLVPACGKCNQSKGNKHWKAWFQSSAKLSPTSRGVPDLERKMQRLQAYEDWSRPTQLDLERIVGPMEWAEYWRAWVEIRDRLTRATAIAAHLRDLVNAGQTVVDEDLAVADLTTASAAAVVEGAGVWVVHAPHGTYHAATKMEAARLVLVYSVQLGVSPDTVQSLVGKRSLRGVPQSAVADPRALWDVFAQAHDKEEQHKPLWFVDSPIHAGGQIWLIANNVWGTDTVERLGAVVAETDGQLSFVTPQGVAFGESQTHTATDN